ncbi:hypothetical protein [Crocosphaera sp.]|uniref:hypothetical protein n=1 Tax=Crocosphaera sp. TaxID=2729996 RepID=UPI00257DB3F2|nr:hypothetical protein [Crocosphaera sp.]NQZ60789.1 hypothetical protein [Crocosphaera sp.]
MTLQKINQLFLHNIKEINKLNIAFGSIIKVLLMGLESNGGVYIRLSDAKEGGHKVSYVGIEGDQTMVVTLGRALSLTVTDTTLEIRHAK